MEYHKEYSKKNGTQRNIEKFGIWNIPGIFQKKKVHNENIENFGIWNIPWNITGIFQKIHHNAWGRKV